MAKKKGPTPARRLNAADERIAEKFATLDALVGQRNAQLADVERRVAQLERLIAACRPTINEAVFATGELTLADRSAALRVLRDIDDLFGRATVEAVAA